MISHTEVLKRIIISQYLNILIVSKFFESWEILYRKIISLYSIYQNSKVHDWCLWYNYFYIVTCKIMKIYLRSQLNTYFMSIRTLVQFVKAEMQWEHLSCNIRVHIQKHYVYHRKNNAVDFMGFFKFWKIENFHIRSMSYDL